MPKVSSITKPSKPVVNTNVKVCYFNTRTYLFLCDYESVVKALSSCSLPFTRELSKSVELDEYMTNNYFKSTSISNKDVYRYKDEEGKLDKIDLEHCLKSDHSVFRLDVKENNVIKNWFSKESLFEPAKEYYEKIIKLLEIYKESFCRMANVKDNVYDTIVFKKSGLGSITEVEDFQKAFKKLESKYKIIKFKLNNYYKKRYAKIKTKEISVPDNVDDYLLEEKRINISSEKNKFEPNTDAKCVYLDVLGYLISKIDDYLDVLRITHDYDFELLAFVNRAGTINLSFVKKDYIKASYDPSVINNNNQVKLICEATKNARIVESNIDRLSKAHLACNINQLFTKKGIIIGQAPEKGKKDNNYNWNDKLSASIYHSTNVKKATYLKFSNDYNHTNNYQDSKMLFFNYFSLLVGYSRQFDDYSLYRIAIKDTAYKRYRKKDIINDLLNQETSHLYYCDSAFTYSIVDPIANAKELDNLAQRKTINSLIPMHQFTIYSKWDFSRIINAVSFGSASNIIHNLFLKYAKSKLSVKRNVFSLLWYQHLLASMFTQINNSFSHLAFDPKERYFDLMNKVFNCMGAKDYEEKANDSLEAAWRYSNLNNNQFYSRIGIAFSIASLFLTLIAFGWIGFIVPTLQEQPGNFFGLLGKALGTVKFYVAIFVASIPLILWLSSNYFIHRKVKGKIENIVNACLMTNSLAKEEKETNKEIEKISKNKS